MSVWQRYQHNEIDGIKVGRLNQGINTQFIVYRFGDTLIDSGPSNQWRYVKSFVHEKPVRQLLLTHHHEDHSGNAHNIAQAFDLVPKAPKLAQTKLATGYKTPVLQRIVWGSLPPVKTQPLSEVECNGDGITLIPVHTPGHAKDLTCFHVPSRGYFFSGDLYLAPRLKMLRSDENLEQLIGSIRKVLNLDFDTLFCPHGGIISNGKEMLNKKLNSILNVAEQAQKLAKNGVDIPTIAQELLGSEELVSKMTGGNFSKYNLIKESLALDL